ncbi:hypothetical protein [Archangium lansingense]|uniref:Uncharacterized protein n=1 Tax=Archangium lansingense TaxID=2995310 RepID=A0ABT4API6_9BACT|nr:hypothetical protein [Archangium lansinium]MCY1083610.1 hypothetical protein [Archangium lansinium]
MISNGVTELELWLVDRRELVDAWTVAFDGLPGVHIREGDILAIAENTIVSLFCPGLATGIGEVALVEAAGEMARAYWKWLARIGVDPSGRVPS